MSDTPEEALLLAIGVREELFGMFEDMFTSDRYHNVLMAFQEGMTYSEISEAAEVSEGTVSNAFSELEDYGLIEKTDEGRQHALPILQHPMIQYYYWNEVVDNGEEN